MVSQILQLYTTVKLSGRLILCTKHGKEDERAIKPFIFIIQYDVPEKKGKMIRLMALAYRCG